MKLLTLFLLVPILFFAYLVLQAQLSKSGQPPGLHAGKLTVCSAKPNCICSEFPDTPHSIAPLKIPAALTNPTDIYNWLNPAIKEMAGNITINNGDYIAATFETRWLGFVDDLELRVDIQNRLLHFRSASRVGYSDLGANKARVEKLIALLNQEK